MKIGSFVIRRKGTHVFFASGGYRDLPLFDGFFNANSYSCEVSAIDAAEVMQDANTVDDVLQIVRVPARLGLHDIFEPMNGPVARIADAVAILLELEDMLTVEKYSALRPMRHAVLESCKGLTEWSTQVGGNLAGDDVVAEVVPGVRDPSRKTAWQKLGETWID